MNNAQYLELFIEESRDHLQNINKTFYCWSSIRMNRR